MRPIKYILTIVTILWSLNAQSQLFPKQKIDVIANGSVLPNAWLGGIDLPQFSDGDIDQDGEKDLIIFDRKANKTVILLKQADGSYKYAPDLEKFFPEMIRFALFRDYNCDGLTDIFAFVNTGIKVYKQEIVGGNITFTEASSILTFDLGGFPVNIYNSNGDIPGIEDVDGDGDMDIGVFYNLGTSLPFYRNMSVENGYGCDSLIYEEYTSCWGLFSESNSNNSVNFDIACKGGSSGQSTSSGPKHVGSTILLFDPNEDGKMDVLLGDVSYNTMVFLQNDNTSLDAHFSSPPADYTYPSYDTPADVEIFPAAFYVDVTNDGKKDLLIAPNATTAHVNTTNSWLYTNTGNTAAPFELTQNNFLIDQTIDVGSYAFPTFLDHNGDGLLDLIVANGYEYQALGTTNSYLSYFENTGTDTLPEFTLMDSDYAGLSNFGVDFIRPTFGDLDADGDQDMVLGDENGFVHYFENSAGAGNPANFSLALLEMFNIDLGNKAHPQLIDLNEDGLLDLVAGREGSYGEIAYFWNFGTPQVASFSIDSSNQALGKIRTNEPGFVPGNSAPFILKTDSNQILYVGNDRGFIASYEINPDSLRGGSFEMLSPGTLPSRAGSRTNLSIVDIDNDQVLDFFVGNSRGGVNYYSGLKSADTTIIDTTSIIARKDESLRFEIFPNPTKDLLVIEVSDLANYNLLVLDATGRVVFNAPNETIETKVIDLSTFQSGIYFLKIYDDQGNYNVKSVLKN